jgi:hypothetical protein
VRGPYYSELGEPLSVNSVSSVFATFVLISFPKTHLARQMRSPFERDLMGREWSEKFAVAVHESGHAVVARHFGIIVAYSRIRPDGSGITPIATGAEDVNREVKVAIKLSGEIAEERYGTIVGRPENPDLHPFEGSRSDRAEARSVALEYTNGDRKAANELLENARINANEIVSSPQVWRAVVALAQLLETNRKVSASEIIDLVDPILFDQRGP